jgi:hypothetical protein
LRILCRISGNSGLSAIVHKTRRAVNWTKILNL